MSENKNPIVTLSIKNYGNIEIELYPEVAPNTVNNFLSLVNKGFYNGIIFHRVVTGFMIQGGDPQGMGIGGPGYQIKGEFSANGFKNDLHHAPGVIQWHVQCIKTLQVHSSVLCTVTRLSLTVSMQALAQ